MCKSVRVLCKLSGSSMTYAHARVPFVSSEGIVRTRMCISYASRTAQNHRGQLIQHREI